MKYRVKVLCLGMLSEPHDFATEAEAEKFAAETRRIPGMIPIIEEMPRLLACGLCYEENGEEVHPHPECRL